jgi:hypothetical protein
MILAAAVLIVFTTSASAKLGAFGLDEMIRKADIIVVGKVEALLPKTGAPTNATVRVTEVLKGAPGDTIALNVQQTWTCDVSEAKAGELILLFVWRDQKTGQNLIYGSGRGRMPIDEVNGKNYATFWPEVRMPSGVEIVAGPEPKFDFIRRANLANLKDHIGRILKETPNKAPEATR